MYIHLTSCLTAIKTCVIKYCTTVYERNGIKIYFGLFKTQVRFLINPNLKVFYHLVCLHICPISLFSILVPRYLIKEKLNQLNKLLTERTHFIWLVMRNALFILNNIKIIFGHVKKFVILSIIFWTIYLFGFDSKFYRKIVGKSKGINFAPLVVDLFCYDIVFLLSRLPVVSF